MSSTTHRIHGVSKSLGALSHYDESTPQDLAVLAAALPNSTSLKQRGLVEATWCYYWVQSFKYSSHDYGLGYKALYPPTSPLSDVPIFFILEDNTLAWDAVMDDSLDGLPSEQDTISTLPALLPATQIPEPLTFRKKVNTEREARLRASNMLRELCST